MTIIDINFLCISNGKDKMNEGSVYFQRNHLHDDETLSRNHFLNNFEDNDPGSG